MGCDIHVYVEHKVNGVWERVSNEAAPIDPFYTDFIAKKPAAERQANDEYFNRRTWDPGRNYILFGALAGVRGKMLDCISNPRGIPEDSCEFIRKEHERWDCDAHSASYFTVEELLAVRDLTCPVTAFFDVKDYAKYKEDGKPENWYSRYSSDSHKSISNAEMDRLIEQVAFWGNEKYVTEVTWHMSYRDSSKGFWETIVNAMSELDPDPKNVRMVFWFDN